MLILPRIFSAGAAASYTMFLVCSKSVAKFEELFATVFVEAFVMAPLRLRFPESESKTST